MKRKISLLLVVILVSLAACSSSEGGNVLDDTQDQTETVMDAEDIENLEEPPAYEEGGHGYGDYDFDEEYPSIDRADYFTGVSYDDLLRNPNSGASVYLSRWTVRQFMNEPYYDYFLEKEINGEYKYLLLNVQYMQFFKQTNNFIEGDTITIYGLMEYVDTVSMTNGTTKQIPVIAAHRVMVNNIPPDTTDMAEALVSFTNTWNSSYAKQRGEVNEYLDGDTVKILCEFTTIDKFGIATDRVYLRPVSLTTESNYIDGYRIITSYARFWDSRGEGNAEFVNMSGLPDTYNELCEKLGRNADGYLVDGPFWITGYVTVEDSTSPNEYILVVNYDIDGIELY